MRYYLQRARPAIWFVLLLILCISCHNEPFPEEAQSQQFVELGADITGLHFSNILTSTKDFNVFNYMYFYNGGGVAVADFNQDGLTDIYFTANMTANALFLNQGECRFRDVTKDAGVAGAQGWAAGACAVDINQDGLMDIYVSQLGNYREISGRNQLFVCQNVDQNGVPHFLDEAASYGLDLIGFGTQASFFDFDRDGDLDMFQLNHSVHQNGTFGQRSTFLDTIHPLSGDRLFRNDNGKFIDITSGSGIISSAIGYGLGVATGDVDLDGWPDLYVCNDFHENDYLYLNQRNGTFREVLTQQIQHTSRFSMGVDIADINNDGFSEIFTLDMLPDDPHILKSSLGEDGYGTFQFKLGYGYNHQYARNNLQLNNRNETFSEIGLLAGVYSTDWSWASLFVDFDNDGFKDLFVSNGIPKRMNDIDYVNFISNDEIQWKIRMDDLAEADMALEEKLPEIKLFNKFYRNTGFLTFEEIKNINNIHTSFSNGAAYADFDQDGDLDIVVNNIEDPPVIYKNLLMEHGPAGRAYLHLNLQGTPKNRQAIGAKLIAYRGHDRIVREQYPVTGYLSSVEYGLHLGLGDINLIDSIHLIWPDGTYQQIDKEMCNRHAHVIWRAGLPVFDWRKAKVKDAARARIQDVTQERGLMFTHEENPFVEFDREALIPHMVSAEGPAMAVGDINGDGLEDVFVGAAKRLKNVMFVQTQDGFFVRHPQPDLARDSIYEDVDAQLIDVDNDGDADLVVASGGNEYYGQAEPLLQRLYRNDGTGRLVRDTAALRGIYMTAACVAANDFDHDGDVDLFFGGRAVPWNYGVIPRSYVLQNDGSGNFTDITESINESLMRPGLVRDAAWGDMNGDGEADLVLAVEWGPLQIFYNTNGILRQSVLDGTNGLWNVLSLADFDGDGDIDFLAGNLGLNSKLKATRDKPVRLYVADFDQNGHIDQLLTYFIGDREILFPTYAEMTKQLPHIKKRYLFAQDFADASIEDLVGAENLRMAETLEVTELESSWFENAGNGQFERHALPQRLQFAPLRAAMTQDFDQDGKIDVMLMGNFYEANIEMGRYDADYGSILFGNANGLENGEIQQLSITGQVRKLRSIHAGSAELILVARNNAPMIAFWYTQGILH